MRQLVELPELPFRVERVAPTAYGRRVLVIFLGEVVVRFGRYDRNSTNFKVSEEVVHQKIQYDERCQNSIEHPHEDEPVPKPEDKSDRQSGGRRTDGCLLIDQRSSVLFFQEHLPNTPSRVEQVTHEANP